MIRRSPSTSVVAILMATLVGFGPEALLSLGIAQSPQSQGNIRRVAGSNQQRTPATRQTESSGGGLFSGIRGIFGGGGGSQSSAQQGNGAIPDAPIGQTGPMQDWSDISHSPTRMGTAPKSSTSKAPAPKAGTTNPNIPKPPQMSSDTRAPEARVATRSDSYGSTRSSTRSDAPVATDTAAGRRATSAASEESLYPPEVVSEVRSGSDSVLPVPKVNRRPLPPRLTGQEEAAPRVAQAPRETISNPVATPAPETGSQTSDSAGSKSSEGIASGGTGRRQNRTEQPGLTETARTPSTTATAAPAATPPSLATPQREVANGSTNPPTSTPPANDGWGSSRATTPSTSSTTNQTPSGNTASSTASTGAAPLAAGATAGALANVSSSTREIPAVRVTTKGPNEIPINQPIEYEVLVENRGNAEAPGLLLRATIPDWIAVRGHHVTTGEAAAENDGKERCLMWQIDRIPAGGTEKLVLKLAAEKANPFDVTVEWTCLPQTNVASVKVQEPKLELTIEGPEQVVFGQSQIYKVRVLNPGSGNAQGVTFTLSPNSATPQSQRLGDIPAGKEAQFEIELSAQDRGELEIHGLVTATGELRSESIKRIKVAAAELVATLDGPPLKYQNTEANYRLVLVNEGTAPSQEVIAQLRIPAGVQYLGGIDGAEVTGDTLRWQVREMQPGQSREYAIKCNMQNTGSHLLAFECRGSAAGNASVAITTKVEAVADLVLSVNDPAAPAPVGSEVVYEIVLKNRGSKAATDIQAIAQFSQNIEPIRAEGHAAKLVTGQVLFDPIARLDAGQEIKLRVYAQAAEGGVHRFRTEITSGETVLVAEEATKYISQSGERVSRKSTDAAVR